MERIQKIIANKGYCSRRKAEELIRSKRVKVDSILANIGDVIDDNAIIEIDGEVINNDKKRYILLYKPSGYITTTSDDLKRRTVIDLLDIKERVYPVGRLDYDTTGVLLLTNDGELANILMHPKNEVPKLYTAKIEGFLSKEEIDKLKKGVMVEKEKVIVDRFKVKKQNKRSNNSIVEIEIHEGKYHEIKNIFLALGHNVIKLKRERYAFLDLSDLKEGEYRELTIKEVRKLYSIRK